MNDDFLHRLRKAPPQAFAARLKAKLERQNPQRPRFSVVRSLVLGLLVAGSAVAATWWIVQGTGSDELRSAAVRAVEPNTGTSRPASPDAVAQRRSFFGSAPVEEANTSARVPAASPPARTSSANERTDEPVDTEASRGGVIGGYAKSSRSTARDTEAPDPRLVRAAGHENGMMLVEAVRGRSGFELKLEQVEDDEAFRRLCGTLQADLVITTRPISEDEMRKCTATLGFKAERMKVLKLGHMGVAISAAKLGTSSYLSPRDIFLALAKRIPDPENPARFIRNTNVSWHQIKGIQERRITFFGPERDSPLAKVFAALILKAGCDTFPSIKALRDTNQDEYHRLCHEIRDDSVYTPVHEDEFFLTQTLWGDPHAIAVLSLPFFDAHRAELSGSLLSGATPTPEAIASGTYEGAVTLFLYARLDTDAEWLARNIEHAIEPPTYLVNYGLILDRARGNR